jgi:hypothetical protein
MACRPVRAALALLVLGAAWSATLDGTVSAYTATTGTDSNAFTAAVDWAAPTAATAAIGRTTAYDTGSISQGASYYVYAQVGDTGNPPSGTASVVANVSSITSGDTAVALTAGSYTAGGSAYNYRSAALMAASSLTAGSYSYEIAAADHAGNAGTQSFNTLVTNTAPSPVDVQSTNVSGGTVGTLDQGDTLTITYSEVMDPYSLLGGWTGASTTGIQVELVDGGGQNADYLNVYTTATTPVQVPVGTINLNSRSYVSGTTVTYGAAGAATPSTMTRTGASISFTLGTPSRAPGSDTTAAAMTWTPSAAATDIAGNAATTATATQTGAIHVNF